MSGKHDGPIFKAYSEAKVNKKVENPKNQASLKEIVANKGSRLKVFPNTNNISNDLLAYTPMSRSATTASIQTPYISSSNNTQIYKKGIDMKGILGGDTPSASKDAFDYNKSKKEGIISKLGPQSAKERLVRGQMFNKSTNDLNSMFGRKAPEVSFDRAIYSPKRIAPATLTI